MMGESMMFENAVALGMLAAQAASMAVSFYYTLRTIRAFRKLEAVRRRWSQSMDDWMLSEEEGRVMPPCKPSEAAAMSGEPLGSSSGGPLGSSGSDRFRSTQDPG